MLHVAPSRGWQVKAQRLELSNDPRSAERKTAKMKQKKKRKRVYPAHYSRSPCDATVLFLMMFTATSPQWLCHINPFVYQTNTFLLPWSEVISFFFLLVYKLSENRMRPSQDPTSPRWFLSFTPITHVYLLLSLTAVLLSCSHLSNSTGTRHSSSAYHIVAGPFQISSLFMLMCPRPTPVF